MLGNNIRLTIMVIAVFGTIGWFIHSLETDSKSLNASLLQSEKVSFHASPEETVKTIQNTGPDTSLGAVTKGTDTSPEQKTNQRIEEKTDQETKIAIVHAGESNIFRITKLKNELIENGFDEILKADSSIGISGSYIYYNNKSLISFADQIEVWLRAYYPHLEGQIQQKSLDDFRKETEEGKLQNSQLTKVDDYEFDRKFLYSNSKNISEISDIIIVIGK